MVFRLEMLLISMMLALSMSNLEKRKNNELHRRGNGRSGNRGSSNNDIENGNGCGETGQNDESSSESNGNNQNGSGWGGNGQGSSGSSDETSEDSTSGSGTTTGSSGSTGETSEDSDSGTTTGSSTTGTTTGSSTTGGFSCNGSKGGKASFYDITSASENDGYANQVSCGGSIPADGLFVAVPSSCFSSSLCNTVITVSYNGNSIQLPILDECASCNSDQIDLTDVAWTKLESNTDIGILEGVTWS